MRLRNYRIDLSVSIALAISTSALTQQLKTPVDPPPDLTLTIQESGTNLRGLPDAIVIKLTNTSNHDISIPYPKSACSDGMYGTLSFRVTITPATGSDPLETGCFADYNFAKLNVSERIKDWKRLSPGEKLVFKKNVNAETEAILKGPLRNGTYEFSAIYDPPYLSAYEKELLRASKISFPQAHMSTPILVFKRVAPE
jgi:hypothetical protein